jgi:hypothetical protein
MGSARGGNRWPAVWRSGASIHVSVTYNRPHSTSWLHRLAAGRRYPQWMVRRAQTELDGFIRLLEAEGVRVRRPEPIDQRRRVHTRLWSSHLGAFAWPALAMFTWSSATRLSKRRHAGVRATSRATPFGNCSKSISPVARAGPLRRGHSCPTSCLMQAIVSLNPRKPSAI